MNLFGRSFSWRRKANGDVLNIDTVIRRLEAVLETASGVVVTPENCEQAPTVKAIVSAISNRFAVMPVHVYRKTVSEKGTSKELLPNHPVERLLSRPNEWQTRASYWQDAASWYVRYGNFYAFKAQGLTGPIRRLLPLMPGSTEPKQDDNWNVSFEARLASGRRETYPPDRIHHVRTRARNGVKGDSWISDVREAIAVEIAAEKFGAALFGNGATPGLVFKYQEGSQGHKDEIERGQFIDDVQNVYAKKGRFRALLLPKGIDLGSQIPVENDKAQFLGVRQYQRTVIAGAAGVPPHLVGDLSKGTFNNVEQQDINFTTNVILPIVRAFETGMERDLLTDNDRRDGVIIRFNPDATVRGDFLTRQQGLQIQRNAGVINADEWREHEGMNPRSDGGGEAYYQQGPSGQTQAAPTSNDQGQPANDPQGGRQNSDGQNAN